MKKLLSILMISIFLMISIPFVSAQRNIQLDEPFMLYYGEQRAILNDMDDDGRQLRFEIDLVDILPGRIIRQGNFEWRFPSSAVITWRLMRRGMNDFWWWDMDHRLISQNEGNFVNIEDRYTLEILSINSGEGDSENVVGLILRRNNLPVIL